MTSKFRMRSFRKIEGRSRQAMTLNASGLFDGRPGAGMVVLRAALDYVRPRYAEADAAE